MTPAAAPGATPPVSLGKPTPGDAYPLANAGPLPGPEPGPGPAPAFAPVPPVDPLPTRRAEYEAFIGPDKAHYYIPRFETFDGGGPAASWNWPASLVTQYWMLYRGMYLWGFLWYPLLSIVVAFTMGLLWGLVGGNPESSWVVSLLFLAGSFVVMGLYSNKLFHGHVLKIIGRSRTRGFTEPQRRDWLIRQGASGCGAIVVLVLVSVAFIGILAAIAIPAYADYTIRAKVSEAIQRAAPAKTSYSEYVLSRGTAPESMASLELPETSENYGSNLGSIEIGGDRELRLTFAGDPKIDGKTLLLTATTGNDTVVWKCRVETLPPKYAPSSCRE